MGEGSTVEPGGVDAGNCDFRGWKGLNLLSAIINAPGLEGLEWYQCDPPTHYPDSSGCGAVHGSGLGTGLTYFWGKGNQR